MITARRTASLALAIALGVASLAVVGVAPAAAVQNCEKHNSTAVAGGRYKVQNNVWGADTPQCSEIDEQTGAFTVTQADHNNPGGAPAAYTSIIDGAHYGPAGPGSPYPLQVSQMGSVTSSWSFAPDSTGTFNAAYDLWFDPVSAKADANAMEMMIWLWRNDGATPAGSVTERVTISGIEWEVWQGGLPWPYIGYVLPEDSPLIAAGDQGIRSVENLDISAFTADALARGGLIEESWYLNSVQAGFEIWSGGTGLASTSFSTTAGGAAPPAAPTAPAEPTATATPEPTTTPSPTPSAPLSPTPTVAPPTPTPERQLPTASPLPSGPTPTQTPTPLPSPTPMPLPRPIEVPAPVETAPTTGPPTATPAAPAPGETATSRGQYQAALQQLHAALKELLDILMLWIDPPTRV